MADGERAPERIAESLLVAPSGPVASPLNRLGLMHSSTWGADRRRKGGSLLPFAHGA